MRRPRHCPESTSFRAALSSGAFGLLVCGILGCEALLSPPRYGQVRVTLAVDVGTPIDNAPVTLYTGQRPMGYGLTDGAGTYTFERVPPGVYGVIATLPDTLRGMAGTTYLVDDDLRIGPGASEAVTLTLVSCFGSLHVTVRDETGRLASGVSVSAYRSFGSPRTEPTGSDGTRTFTALPCGEYGVKVEPTSQYAPVTGQGGSYVDGLRLSREQPIASAVLRVHATGAASSVRAEGVRESLLTKP
jgi:hypothetical protein